MYAHADGRPCGFRIGTGLLTSQVPGRVATATGCRIWSSSLEVVRSRSDRCTVDVCAGRVAALVATLTYIGIARLLGRRGVLGHHFGVLGDQCSAFWRRTISLGSM